MEKQQLINYIYDFAGYYSRYNHVGKTPEKVLQQVSEYVELPEKIVEEFTQNFQKKNENLLAEIDQIRAKTCIPTSMMEVKIYAKAKEILNNKENYI